ncbi:MAG TPA: hypothetical protein VGG65_05380 [Thermoanaerobaculia bacterium]
MSSEKLVSISWYATQDEANAEFLQLQEAGLAPSIAGEYRHPDDPVEILVPESEVEAARELLHILPEDQTPPEAVEAAPARDFRCPECRSSDTAKVPSYAFRALVASLVLFGVSSALGKPAIGVVVVVVGWIVALGLTRHAGKYRCRACGREWDPENA